MPKEDHAAGFYDEVVAIIDEVRPAPSPDEYEIRSSEALRAVYRYITTELEYVSRVGTNSPEDWAAHVLQCVRDIAAERCPDYHGNKLVRKAFDD